MRFATAIVEPTQGNQTSGTIEFESIDDGVCVTGTIANLKPNTKHGFHVHENGDCSAADGSSAGGHFSPDKSPHALPPKEPRHAGDMGNIEANDQGRVTLDETFPYFSLDGQKSIVGRAVIVHATRDDGGQPSGHAGARIACGVIEAGTVAQAGAEDEPQTSNHE